MASNPEPPSYSVNQVVGSCIAAALPSEDPSASMKTKLPSGSRLSPKVVASMAIQKKKQPRLCAR